MLKKVFQIFSRDLRVASRDSMAFVIMVMPLVLAIGLTFFIPGLNDTTVNIAMLESGASEHVEYIEQFAKVEVFGNLQDLMDRVNRRDDVAAIVPKGDAWEIIVQGNEPEIVASYTKALNALYELDATIEETSATMFSFGYKISPLKTKLVNMLIIHDYFAIRNANCYKHSRGKNR